MKRMIFAETVRNFCFLILTFLTITACKAQNGSRNITFNINTDEGKREISPYIYGVNDFKFPIDSIKDVNIPNRRLGGNAYSTYNWVNNDITLSPMNTKSGSFENESIETVQNFPENLEDQPGGAITYFHDQDIANHMESLITLPIMGFVARDKNGALSDNEAPPSSRFAQVKPNKNGSFSLNPDPNSPFVYTDETVNFLVNKYGDSKTKTGIKFYALDNEPNYWIFSHKFSHPAKPTGQELLIKSLENAKAIKSVDPNAMIFALSYGSLNAHWNFQNDPTFVPYKRTFPSYTAWFLKNMKDASNRVGYNVIDVIDLHYYSQAEGVNANGQVETVDKGSNDIEVAKARMDAPLSLWNDEFVEQGTYTHLNGGNALQVIPDLQKTIDDYFPGIKISFGEYNFGGWNHISGGIAEVDALGIFAREGVFWASLWNTCPGPRKLPHYELAGIKMYRNYDGKFSTFGNVMVEAKNEVRNRTDLASSVYASFNAEHSKELHIIVINKSLDKSINGAFNIKSQKRYVRGEAWKLDDSGYEIKKTTPVDKVTDNTFNYVIPPLSVVHIVLESE